jgi:hypothetical protein
MTDLGDLGEISGNRTLAYLATPYSKFTEGPEAAFRAACRLSAKLLCAGVTVYSPIAHTHPIAKFGALDLLDHSIWLPFDEAMMGAAKVLIVARMPGWEESVGIAHEIKFFKERSKPIYDLDPDTLHMVRRPGAMARSDSINEMIAAAKARYDALTPEQKAQHDHEQRRSFVRGMCPSAHDYAEWCKVVDRILPPQRTEG